MRTRLNTMFVLLLAGIAILVTASAQAAEKKAKVLIMTGFDVPVHKWDESSRTIHAILDESGRFDVTISTDKEDFASPSLGDYQAIVLSYGFWKEPDPSDQAKSGLLDYVDAGGSVVALHFACSAFQDWDQYAVLLGRVWKKGVAGHGPYGEFEVNISNPNHPITKGLKDFEIQDELYAKLTGDEEIEILAEAYSDWSERVEPMVFVKRYGEGRVVQNVLGHDFDSKQNASYKQLLVNGVEWAATGKVTGQ